MITFETLEQLLKAIDYNRLTFNQFFTGRAYFSPSWNFFDLPDSEVTRAAKLFAGVIYSRGISSHVDAVKYYNGKTHGIFDRLYISINRDGKVKADYCAGQYYPAEIHEIQKIIREN